jgi:catechol 2,3-dioxygenase-like lactoylglutathione lyase family enzyme
MFKETHPILGTRDIQRAIEFYTQLGFEPDQPGRSDDVRSLG